MKDFVLSEIVRKNLLKMKPYSCARDEYGGSEGIFLDANENPFGELNRYPDPRQSALKRELSLLNDFPESGIFLGNGSDEVIDLTLRIFCNPGKDKILIFPPTYGMYKVCADVNDVEALELSLDSAFQIDLRAMEPLLRDETLKVIFVCSPNNPTGNLINREDIEYVLENFAGVVFVDEAYIDFAGSRSLIREIDRYPNLIVSRTFSKSRALASSRIGIAFARPEITAYYNKVKYPYNISLQNQTAALDALNDKETFEKRMALILDEKQKLLNKLPEIPSVRKIYPSDANFLLIEFDDAAKIYSELIAMKIITRIRSSVVRNCIRITVGTPEENAILLKSLSVISAR